MAMHLVRKITLLTYMVGVLFATGAGSPALAQRASGQPSWTKLLPETTVALAVSYTHLTLPTNREV